LPITPKQNGASSVTINGDDDIKQFSEYRKNATIGNTGFIGQYVQSESQRVEELQEMQDLDIMTMDINDINDININKERKEQKKTINKEQEIRLRRKAKKKAKKKAAKQKKKELSEQQDINTLNVDIVDFDDFDVGDSKEIHEEHENYQIQRNEMQQKQEELMQEKEKKYISTISYDSILNKNKKTYIYGGRGFDIFDDNNSEIYTSTMLRFSGINGLREDNESDKDLVRKVICSEIKFQDDQIENIQIRNGRSWCIVYVRSSMKFIRDRIKKQEAKNKKIYKQNIKNKPIYRISEYIRRPQPNGINVEDEKEKLYILNFDILNKNCHKALTNLFLKFGDLMEDIQIGINSRKDPFAKVTYRHIEDAKTLWKYQNVNGHPKITFGKRQLTIQYAKY